MFTNRFTEIQNKTDLWKYQRYELVYEYRNMFAFPPPINFIAWIILALRKLKNNDSIENDPINGFKCSNKNKKNLERAISLENKYTHMYYIDEIQNNKLKIN